MSHSLAQQASLNCPQCARSFTADIWLIVDASERPDLLDHIQAGTLHDLPCPHCGHAGQVDAPILLYRPNDMPPLIFSPAHGTTEEQDRDQAQGLLGYLHDVLGNAWRDEWLAAMPAIPREFLPAALSDDPEAAIRQMAMQAEQALAQLREEDPDTDEELKVAARRMAEETTDTVMPEQTLPTVSPQLFIIQQFVEADDWLESYRFVQAHPELLGSEAITLLDALVKSAEVTEDGNARRIFGEHRALLRRCQEIGITEAFAEKLEVPAEALMAQSKIESLPPAVREVLAELARSSVVINSQEDLERALAARPDLQAKLAAIRDGGPDVPPQFQADFQQAHTGVQRYLQRGDQRGLDEAAAAWERILQNPTFTNAPLRFQLAAYNDSGGVFLRRYWAQGQMADLNRALQLWQTAVQRTPPDSPDLPTLLNNLGTGLRDRYARTGQLADLEEAIRVTQTAVQCTPPESPDLPGSLNNLGIGLRARYARTGQLADLEEAIRAWQTAVQRTPPDSLDLPMYANNLGNGLSDRYARTGKLADLEEAIRAWQTAVKHTPPDSLGLPSRLNNLGTGLGARYARTGQLADLEEAIRAWRTAVQRTPPESPDLPMYRNNLGNGLSARYACTGHLADLEEAIRAWQTTVQRTPPDSPELPMYLNNLGTGLRDRYARTGHLADLEEAIRAYEKACQLGQERQVSEALRASRNWGNWALARHAWDEAVRAFQYGLTTLEHLYQTQLLQQEQQSWQREGQGLYARAAYALARLGELSAAVALEQGQARGLNDRLARDEADLRQVEQQAPTLFQRYQAVAERLRQLEAAERHERLTGPGVTTPPDWAAQFDWATHRQQVQQARTDLQGAIAAIRQLDGYGQFLQPPAFADVATTVRPDHPLAYLVTTPIGSLTLLLHRPAANADVIIEPCWADAFTEDNLNAFLVKRENGEEPGGYLPGQFFGGPTLQTALTEGLPLLGETLLAPLAQRLQAIGLQRVILIPGGRLNLLPLHAVTVTFNGQPAIFGDLFAVSYAPSARALSLSYHRRREYEATTPRLLAVGNPLPLPDDASPLPYARLEAEEIARRFGQGALLVCDEAGTHAAIAAAMPGRTHLHFACHGQFDPGKPLESGLLLGGDTLTLRQILDDITLRGVRLAVLSACQTAISDYKDLPDEVIGLPAAFLQAGAAGVLGSLWPVNDLSTMLLMDRFYHLHLDEGVEAAIALQRAQRWLREVTAGKLADRFGDEWVKLKDGSRLTLAETGDYWRRFAAMEPEERPFSHPYYWAAFTFTGV